MDTYTFSDSVIGMTWVLVGIFVLLVVQLLISIHLFEDYGKRGVEEDPAWECGFCLTRIYSNSVEGMFEGIRIHKEIMGCPDRENNLSS